MGPLDGAGVEGPAVATRWAGPDEAVLLAAISEEGFTGNERWDAGSIVALLELPGAFALISEAADGMAVFRLAADEAELLTLAVRVHARRRGVGRALLRRGMSECGRLGAARLLLEVSAGNPAGRALYGSCGFVPVGRRAGYYRDGSDAVVMAAALTGPVMTDISAAEPEVTDRMADGRWAC